MTQNTGAVPESEQMAAIKSANAKIKQERENALALVDELRAERDGLEVIAAAQTVEITSLREQLAAIGADGVSGRRIMTAGRSLGGETYEAVPATSREVIQQAANEIERPEGVTDVRWEYLKAGARLLINQVNSVLARRRIKDEL